MEARQQNGNVLNNFKKSLIAFMDELIETFPDDGDFITLRILVKDQIPIQVIMDTLINDLDNIKQMVISKDDKFFIDGNIIFEQLDRVENFRKVWTSPGMTQENKDATWGWFTQFVFFAEKYLENIVRY